MIQRQVITTLYSATLIPYKYDFSLSYERGLRISVSGYVIDQLSCVDSMKKSEM